MGRSEFEEFLIRLTVSIVLGTIVWVGIVVFFHIFALAFGFLVGVEDVLSLMFSSFNPVWFLSWPLIIAWVHKGTT